MKIKNKFINATALLSVTTFAYCTPGLMAQSTTVVVPNSQPPPQPPPVIVQPAQPAPPPPSVVVQTPAPPPESTLKIDIPESYVWDGYEYIGVVGDQYYYLGPDNVWLPVDKEVLKHFNHWEKHHTDWRKEAIRNEKFRRDAQGHDYPVRDHDDD